MAEIDKNTLERYVALDKQIHEAESRNSTKALSVKEEQLRDLEKTIKQLQQHYDKCVQQTTKEKNDVDQLKSQSNLKNIFENQAAFDTQMTKEQEEYLDALNKQEIAKKELDGVTQQYEETKKVVEKLSVELKDLYKLYDEFDDLLSAIFKGEYGSPEENRLEGQLDNLLDKKQRVQVAHYKWTNARELLVHAVGQLTTAEQKWAEVIKVPANEGKKRYDLATEARNNIIASAQNLNSAQQYLNNITFPYCAPAEVETLNRAAKHIYTDMLTNERHAHAGNVYTVTRKRASALLQWFDNVINNTISKDLDSCKAEANAVESALRKERLALIKMKIAEANGIDVGTVSGEMDLGKDASKESTNQYISKPEGPSKNSPAATPSGVPLSQLAPAPSQEQIFGEMDSLKKQHEKDVQEFEKAQEMNKTRTEQGLQEKLAARRNKRQRMQAQTEQASQLGN